MPVSRTQMRTLSPSSSAPSVIVPPSLPVQAEPPVAPPQQAALPPAVPEVAPAREPAPKPKPAAATPVPPKPVKKASRPPWGVVGVLVIALIAVGSWIGLHLSGGRQDDNRTAMVPVPPPSEPMSATAPPPAAMPPGTADPAAAAAAAAPAASAPASAPAGPLTPLDNVPVAAPLPAAAPAAPAEPAQAPAPSPEAALALTEIEDWNLAQAENTREGYEAYLRRYRRGPHARDARNAIAELNRQAQAQPPAPIPSTNPVPTVIAGGAPLPATPAPPVAAPGNGRLQFNIRPWGQVFVDGVDRGVSPPLKTLSLRPGIYNVEVRNGDLEVFRQRVTVQDGKSAPVVSHEFK